jgi:hypothetical protein
MNSLQVSLAQAATLIRTCGGTNTFLLQGAPGVGKSSILKTLAREMPDYLPCYIDVANLDLGDLGMPVIDREAMVTNYAPNARFGVGREQNRPVLLMLDELGKASRPVLNMLLPVILEHRIGDVTLPIGSIVFGTTNLATDGVGDNIPAQAHNRMTVLDVGNPAVEEWLIWAAENNVAPEVMAFAREFPQVFERYDLIDAKSKNPYIFNPLTGNTKAFCSLRSLESAGNLIKNRDALGDALLPALAGTIGAAAARDMDAMIQLADQMPRFNAVIADPAKAKLPGGAGAYFLMAFMLAGRANAESMDSIMTYVERWTSAEARILFITTLAGNKTKVVMAVKCQKFSAAAAKVGKYF